MNFLIRNASINDLPQILKIYADARQYMRQSGNPNQWGDSHPTESMIRKDIAAGLLYVCTQQNEILGVFYYKQGIDPTYLQIFDGNWLNEAPYGVIHRIAVAAHRKGVASSCFDFALCQCPNLRIDTHRDNIPMQKSLQKNGFQQCGIIHLENGDERIAFHKSI